MRALKIATIVMGVLIVIGTIGLIVGLARRTSAPAVAIATVPAGSASPSPALAPLPAFTSVVMDEPAGTRIAGIVALRDRLAIQLAGGGIDRVVLIDPATGTIAGRISLAR